MSTRLEIFAIPGLPMVRAGDDLASLIADAVESAGTKLRDGDVVVVAQKIVSKAEGRTVDLATVTPTAEAIAKPARPATKVHLRPKKSEMRPPSRSRLPNASA